jgi:hypothetical protein
MNWYTVGNTALKLIDAVFRRDPKLVKEVFEELANQINLHDNPFTQPPLDYEEETHS